MILNFQMDSLLAAFERNMCFSFKEPCFQCSIFKQNPCFQCSSLKFAITNPAKPFFQFESRIYSFPTQAYISGRGPQTFLLAL